jgi:hypothetical protein
VKHTAADFPGGVYYRCFEWTGEPSDWTLMVNCLYSFLLFAILPLLWFRRRWQSLPRHSIQPVPTHGTASGG